MLQVQKQRTRIFCNGIPIYIYILCVCVRVGIDVLVETEMEMEMMILLIQACMHTIHDAPFEKK